MSTRELFHATCTRSRPGQRRKAGVSLAPRYESCRGRRNWQFSQAGGTVTFKYDPFGRRIQKAGPSGTVNFAYDGANVVEELNTAGTATAQYAQGTGIDEPMATNRGGTLAFYEADGLGSVTSLTDGTGSALAAYTTDAFGKPISTADSTVNNVSAITTIGMPRRSAWAH